MKKLIMLILAQTYHKYKIDVEAKRAFRAECSFKYRVRF